MIKKPDQKERKKYKHIYPQSTYKNRSDFIETEYVKGVYNQNGEQVIRPLTTEELNFLDNFYKESVHDSFSSNDETKLLVKEIRKIKGEYSRWKRKKGNKGKTNPEIEKRLDKKVKAFNKLSKQLGGLYTDYESQAAIRKNNYQSRNCIINTKKHTNNLDSFDIEELGYDSEKNDTYIEDLITSGEED